MNDGRRDDNSDYHKKRDFNEKRDFIRMKIDTPVEMIISRGGESSQGLCLDLSGGGMRIKVEKNKEMCIGTELKVTLSSDAGHNPMLKATAVVTRVEKSNDSYCILGLEIQQMLA